MADSIFMATTEILPRGWRVLRGRIHNTAVLPPVLGRWQRDALYRRHHRDSVDLEFLQLRYVVQRQLRFRQASRKLL